MPVHKEKETPPQALMTSEADVGDTSSEPGKSPAAYRTIGEVAAELALPSHVLRFWESKFTQIKPHKRRGGHRYYRPADVDALREIKALLYERGYTIKGAQKYLRDMKKQNDGSLPGSVNDNYAEAAIDLAHPGTLQEALDELLKIRELLEMPS